MQGGVTNFTVGQKMKHIVIIVAILFINSIVLGQSEAIVANDWQTISMENAYHLTFVSEFLLTKGITNTVTESIYLVPHSTILFTVSYNHSSLSREWNLWDIAYNQTILEKPIETSFRNVTFSPRGRFLAIGIENSENPEITDICLWDIILLELLNCFEGNTYVEMFFTPDESTFLFPTNNSLIGWNINTNSQAFLIPQQHLSNVISPDGHQIALYSVSDISISVWDITTVTPSLLYKHQDTSRVIISDITFDYSGRYIFFMTVPLADSSIREFAIWDTMTGKTSYIERESFQGEFFSNSYSRLFLFRVPDDRFTVDIVDVLTEERYGTMSLAIPVDYTLAQDIFIAREETENGFTWSVKNFETQETLFTLYENADDNLLDVRFTQDERFILAYTEDGRVQLWGVPAEG